ncbi:MAG: pyridoxal phosphate-dependent aminotransferase [Candidatus Heimdallarchaeaceae archaeon]
MTYLANHLIHFQESVIREMTRKAIKHQAINLSQGMPDFSPPSTLIEGLKEAIKSDDHQYTVTYGKAELREKISEKLKSYNNIYANPESEITITCGASEAISSSLLAVLNPGEEIIILEPWYENYVPITYLAHAKPVFVSLNQEDFSLNEEGIKAKISDKTKAIIVNSPHNPTGRVFSDADFKLLSDICIDYDLIAVTDEIYEYIIYDNKKHVSLGSIDGMSDRTITVSGFSKTFSITGWRLGYVAAQTKLMQGIRKVHDYLTVCAPSLLQNASLRVFDLNEDYFESLRIRYKENRDFLYEQLTNLDFKIFKPSGAYYMFADISSFGMNDIDFADYLVKDKGVAVVPGSSFYNKEGEKRKGQKYVRFSYSQKLETLKEAIERITQKTEKI